ncbi:DUF222 domain-containing protein [Gordonia sp. NPDC003429]
MTPTESAVDARQALLAQLAEDEDLEPDELVEVLFHSQASKASADYRILQAAVLIYELREYDYLARVEALLGSRQIAAPEGCTDPAELARLFVRPDVDPAASCGPDGLTAAISEVGATLTMTPAQAKRTIELGGSLRYRLPLTGQALAVGRIDLARFADIVARTELVDDAHIKELDAVLADLIFSREPMSTTRLRTMVEATVERIDPDATRRRRETAEKRRYIAIRPHRDQPGHSSIDGQLPATQAAVLDARLNEMVGGVHSADPRTHAQRRADSLVALARGHQHLPCECAECANAASRPADPASPTIHDASPAPDCGSEHGPRPTFHIVVNLSTALGHDNDPAFLDGHGLIDADTARRLLTEARRNYVHPDHENSARASFRYPIPRKLKALVQAGELCCTFPGCTNKVRTADLDHTDPFNHTDPTKGGRTERRNLKPLCRRHHRYKTFAVGWRDHQTPLGTVIFESPTGHMFVGNAYTGRDLFRSLAERDQPPDHRVAARLTTSGRDAVEKARAATAARRSELGLEGPPPF